MNKPPETIWLQWNGDGDPDGSPVSVGDVTWSAEQVFEHDEQYLRLSDVLPLLENAAANISTPSEVWKWMKERGFA